MLALIVVVAVTIGFVLGFYRGRLAGRVTPQPEPQPELETPVSQVAQEAAEAEQRIASERRLQFAALLRTTGDQQIQIGERSISSSGPIFIVVHPFTLPGNSSTQARSLVRGDIVRVADRDSLAEWDWAWQAVRWGASTYSLTTREVHTQFVARTIETLTQSTIDQIAQSLVSPWRATFGVSFTGPVVQTNQIAASRARALQFYESRVRTVTTSTSVQSSTSSAQGEAPSPRRTWQDRLLGDKD